MTDSTEKSDVVQTSDDTALWMPLVAGMLLLVLATVLTLVVVPVLYRELAGRRSSP